MSKLSEVIIEKSYQLFTTVGYNKVTVNQIVSEVGCSKGGFYHHFSSKEQLLDSMIDNYIIFLDRHLERREAIEIDDSSAIEDLNEFIMKYNEFTDEESLYKMEMYNLLYSIDNPVLLMKVRDKELAILTKHFTTLITQGIDDGSFKVVYIDTTAGLFAREFLRLTKIAYLSVVSDERIHVKLTFPKALLDFQQGIDYYQLLQDELYFFSPLLNLCLGLTSEVKIFDAINGYPLYLQRKITNKLFF